MKTYLDEENAEVRIEILPLIDVIFCILTFFILAAVGLTRPEGIEMDLPQAETGKAQMANNLDVRLDVLGNLYIEKQPVSPDQLKQSLLSYIRANPQGVIVLNADKLANYDQVIQVLDLLQSVGGNRVALGTTSPANEAAPTEGLGQPGLPGQLPDTLPAPPINPGSAPSQLPPLPGQEGEISPAPPTPRGTVQPGLSPGTVPPSPPPATGLP
ncbi:MAG: ExbD/TolR family protein [Thermosynechococcaceae cyanobacterium]